MPIKKTECTIVKANQLIQAGYRLTLAEQHVLLSAISLIRRDEDPSDHITYSVSVTALSRLTDTSTQRAYKELAEVADRLYRREVRIEGGPNGCELGPLGKRYTMTRWVQSIEYIKGEGRIELRFAHEIVPYLTLLKKEFTSYKMINVAKMSSTHGIRLYELLCQWRQTGEREIKIEDFKYMFGIDGCYSSIKDLKKYVLQTAVDDVNKNSDLNVKWEQKKVGRRIAAFFFKFEQKDTSESHKSHRKSRDNFITHADLEENSHLAKKGESWESFRRRVEANPDLIKEVKKRKSA